MTREEAINKFKFAVHSNQEIRVALDNLEAEGATCGDYEAVVDAICLLMNMAYVRGKHDGGAPGGIYIEEEFHPNIAVGGRKNGPQPTE